MGRSDSDDKLAIEARRSMEGDDEATILSLLRDVVRDGVEDKLDFNVRAYGKAWTGEDVPDAIIERLREAGFEVVRTRG
jgi:hypothetical protein